MTPCRDAHERAEKVIIAGFDDVAFPIGDVPFGRCAVGRLPHLVLTEPADTFQTSHWGCSPVHSPTGGGAGANTLPYSVLTRVALVM